MKRGWWIATLGLALAAAGLAIRSGSLSAEQPEKPARLEAVGPEVVWSIPWGAGPSSAGRKDGVEAASEGPMSFALDDAGDLRLLDQVNGRVLALRPDGSVSGEVAIPTDTFQDLEVVRGALVVLDRLARRTLLVIDPGGKAVGEFPIEGEGIPEGGGVTAMFAEDDGIWLEFDHTERVRVLDADLSPCARQIVRGRRFRPGEQLLAAREPKGSARIWVEDAVTGNTLRSVGVSPDHAVARVAWLQADRNDGVHAVFHLLEFDPADPTRVTFEQMLGVRYDEALQQRAVWRSPWVIRTWEQFREFRVMPDGTTYQMGFDETGVTIARWRWVS